MLGIQILESQLAQHVAAAASAIGGLDVLIFTAGIGEHIAQIREAVVSRIAFLGVRLDSKANAKNKRIISTETSRVKVLIIKADETMQMAREGYKLLRNETA
ncbi:MAG: hypothetical protein HC945_02750 [Nitrosarchaeum sp.]|nr:hypothetical protein [Nitrosarchaeum sp.]